MNKPDLSRLPKEFLKEYRKNITLRTVFSMILMVISFYIALINDFSGIKYPFGAKLLVILTGFVLTCVLFRFHDILLKPSWCGEIIDVHVEKLTKTKERGFVERNMVIVKIDRGTRKQHTSELFKQYKNKQNRNIYQIYAPFKNGDKVVYLRGMKIFSRYGIENVDELSSPMTVCPFCGEVGLYKDERCPECRKPFIK